MSLKEKLFQKEEEQKTVKEEEAQKNFQEQIFDIDSQIKQTKNKKDKIIALKTELQDAYHIAQTKIDIFGGEAENLDRQSSKKELHTIYQEHQKTLKDEGIKNYQEMIQANPDEEEVRNYREKASNMKEALVSVVDIKKKLKAELPDLELNFSGGIKEGEEENNRELSFNKIDEYLQALDRKVLDLEKEHERLYFETPEGKPAKIKQELGDFENRLFKRVQANHLDNFSIGFKEMEVADKNNLELVKDILKQGLAENLKEKILNNKSAEEREALNNYEKIKVLNSQEDLYQEIQNTKNLEQEAIKHLDQIFKNNEEILDRIRGYFRNGRGNFKTEGAQFLHHIIRLSDFSGSEGVNNSLDDVLKQYTNDRIYIQKKDFSNNYQSKLKSSKYYSEALNNYRLVFQDIIANTTKETKFFSKEINDPDILVNRFSRDNKKEGEKKSIYEKLGIVELKDQRGHLKPGYELEIPQSLRNHSYEEISQKAEKENIKWNKEKEEISQASALIINKKWAESYQAHYIKNNKKFIEGYNRDKEYCRNARDFIYYLQDLSPEEQEHLVSFVKNFSNNLIIRDETAEKFQTEFRKKQKELEVKKDNYIQEIVYKINQKAQKVGSGFFGSKKKKIIFEEKAFHLQSFIGTDFKKLNNLGADFSSEEKQELENIYKEYLALEENYNKQKKINDDLDEKLNRIKASGIVDDFIADKHLSIKDLINHCQNEEKDKTNFLDNLPDNDQEILNNIAKNEKEVEDSDKEWDEKKFNFKYLNKV